MAAPKLIPEYTADQGKSWLDSLSQAISTTAEVVLILITFAGFVVFVMGIMRYMRAAREGMSGQGGDGYREAIWMIVIGVLFAFAGSIYIFAVGIGRSELT